MGTVGRGHYHTKILEGAILQSVRNYFNDKITERQQQQQIPPTNQNPSNHYSKRFVVNMFQGVKNLFGRNKQPPAPPPLTYIPADANLSPKYLFERFYGKDVKPDRFQAAIKEMKKNIAMIDEMAHTKDNPAFHFDAERFRDANQKAIKGRTDAINFLRQGKFLAARQTLAQMLHTVHDFYSHSNWVEIGNDKPNYHLATSGENQWLATVAKPLEPTCSDCTNWLMNCETNILPSILKRRILTSGFYSHQQDDYGNELKKPPGKCSHGGALDGTSKTAPRGGINKDSSIGVYSPHANLHNMAAGLAEKGSGHIFDQFRKEVGDDYFARLFDILPDNTLTAVVRRRSVSRPRRRHIKRQVQDDHTFIRKTLETAIGNNQNVHTKYVLVIPGANGFNDEIREFDNAEDFKAAATQVGAEDTPKEEGGGNGPGDDREDGISLKTLFNAVDASNSQGNVLVFENSRFSHAHLEEPLAAYANHKGVVVNFVGRRHSSQLQKRSLGDSDYIGDRISNRTGGLSVDSHADGDLMYLNHKTLHPHRVLLASVSRSDSVMNSVDVMVDSMVEALVISFLHESGDANLKLQMPNMEFYDFSSTQVLSDTASRKILKIIRPQAGVWKLKVVGTQMPWTIEVMGESKTEFTATFVRANEETDAVVDIPKVPGIGENLFLIANHYGPQECDLPEAHLLNSEGRILGKLPLTLVAEGDESYAKFRVPSEGFFIMIFGICGNESRKESVQRLHPSFIVPSRVIFEPDLLPDSESISPGESKIVRIDLRNSATEGLAVIKVTDSAGFVQNYTKSIPLDQSGRSSVEINLAALSSALIGSSTTIHITASVSGTHERSYIDKTVIVRPPSSEDRNPLPSCKVKSLQAPPTCHSAGSEVCKTSFWNATLSVKAGSLGIDTISLDQAGGYATWQWANNDSDLDESSGRSLLVRGSCCVFDAKAIIQDYNGEIAVCELFSREPNQVNGLRNLWPLAILTIAIISAISLILIC